MCFSCCNTNYYSLMWIIIIIIRRQSGDLSQTPTWQLRWHQHGASHYDVCSQPYASAPGDRFWWPERWSSPQCQFCAEDCPWVPILLCRRQFLTLRLDGGDFRRREKRSIDILIEHLSNMQGQTVEFCYSRLMWKFHFIYL